MSIEEAWANFFERKKKKKQIMCALVKKEKQE